MKNAQPDAVIDAELIRITAEFFHAVSFEVGQSPPYEHIRDIFMESGLLIKNVGTTPEISTVSEFITPRRAQVKSGALSRFHESELSGQTVIFGNVAHRFSAYQKSGTLNGTSFEARGMISTQFILTPVGWKISAMAWDDERAGLQISDEYLGVE
ncbi:MAG: hypothetical protein V4628_17690 [Pseudomonadota bacterium]